LLAGAEHWTDTFCSRRNDAVLAAAEVGGTALVIDAKDEKDDRWYASRIQL
jgi:hypothetical protein